MVGFRVFDVGLLILWLVWFFRLRTTTTRPTTTVRAAAGPTPHRTTAPAAAASGCRSAGPRSGPRTRDHKSPCRTSRAAARSRAAAAHRAHETAGVTAAGAPPGLVLSRRPGFWAQNCSNRSAGEPGSGGVSFAGESSGRRRVVAVRGGHSAVARVGLVHRAGRGRSPSPPAARSRWARPGRRLRFGSGGAGGLARHGHRRLADLGRVRILVVPPQAARNTGASASASQPERRTGDPIRRSWPGGAGHSVGSR